MRRWGELLFTFAREVGPRQGVLVVEGEQIELDPGLSAVANAQRYFKEYQKAKAGMAEVPQLLETVEARAGVPGAGRDRPRPGVQPGRG